MTATTLSSALAATESARAFGSNLRRLREVAGLSQGRLALMAALLGGQPQVSLYEAGRIPTLVIAARLASALGCSLDELTEGC